MDTQGYQKEDFEQLSWSEYDQIMDRLYVKLDKYLSDNEIKIDAMVPILRSGAVPGIILAFKMKLLKILPVQYKYLSIDGKTEIKRILVPNQIDCPLPESSTLLVVENNHCCGNTSSLAIKDLLDRYPGCKIIYATARMDYSHQEVESALAVFYGELTNESRELTKSQAEELRLNNRLAVFPWETVEEEWAEVSESDFAYQNIDQI